MIEVRNVKAGYDNKQILNGVTFNVSEGESLSIIGQNGCGKSTLLRVLSGNLDFSGEVFIDGVDIRKIKSKELAKKVCMLSQTTQIYFNYTVYDTVMMGRYVHQKGGFFSSITDEDRDAVIKALEVVNLLEFKDKAIDTLSGGQLQRVFLAKVIAQDPEIVLLDEPTNHLDLCYQVEFVNFLKAWSKEKNKVIIGVIHDINLAMELAPRTMVMDKGEIKIIGNNEDVFVSEEFSEIYKMDVINFMVSSFKKWEKIGQR